MNWFELGPLPGTPHARYAMLEEGAIVKVVISRPEGDPQPRPSVLQWKVKQVEFDMQPEFMNAQKFTYSKKANGEQPRRVFSRVKKAAL